MWLASDRSVRDLEEWERNTPATDALSSTIHPGEVVPFNVHDTSLNAHGQHVLLWVSNALVDLHFSGTEIGSTEDPPVSSELADGLWADASTSGPFLAGLVADDGDFGVQEYATVPSMQGAPEYFQMDGGVWDEPGVSEWRLAPSYEAMTGSEQNARDEVEGRGEARTGFYDNLARILHYSSWSGRVEFALGRFRGVPTVCVE
ncbi:MAG: hypothetical protein H6700_11365 [Myxococcales bacterium]|nr:hypothetical protein [Myxococcales bacterium]